MSRSYKKAPVSGNAKVASEKKDKQLAHRALRVHFRTGIVAAADTSEFLHDERNEAHSNVYSHAKDGKQWMGLRVAYEGRAIRILGAPAWARGEREVHQLLAK